MHESVEDTKLSTNKQHSLSNHLVSFSREATTLSHANTLHACPAHLQPEMQISSIDMYNNDVGQESAQKFMK